MNNYTTTPRKPKAKREHLQANIVRERLERPRDNLESNLKDGHWRGWSFIPLEGKKPKLPGWTARGRASLIKVLKWIQRGLNIGLRTGRVSGGIVVIDEDAPGAADRLNLPPTVTARTGGGGRHYYFLCSRKLKNSSGKLGDRIDVKAEGGQVVFPGSTHPKTGKRYRWLKGRAPWEIEIAKLPARIAIKLNDSRTRGQATYQEPIPEGSRNDALARSAGVMRARGFSPEAIESALLEENEQRCKPPLDPEEVRKIANSIGKYPGAEEDPTAAIDVRLGDEFVAAYVDTVRYCADTESWLVWDSRRWEPDAVHSVERLMQELARRRLAEAANIPSDNARDKEIKFWTRAMHMQRITAGLQAARSAPEIVVRLAELDADPWLLNTMSGTVDLQSARGRQPVKVRDHDPADLITKICPVPFDPAADQEEWGAFLGRVIPDPAMIYFLQKAVGYSLTGLGTEEVLFHISGPTASGKSTFISAVRSALGDYAASANFESFLQQHNKGGPRSDLVRLAGKRFVSSIETEEGSKLAGGLLKWITGQDPLCVRTLYKPEVEFLPAFTLWLVANFLPRAADDDSALWRRLMLIPFDVTIPKNMRDPEVKRRLSDPEIGGPAVLAWAIRGCAEWRYRGLDPPPTVRTATRAWRAENDPLADWLTERTVLDSKGATPFADLQRDYRAWVEEQGLRPISAKKLATRLQDRGCQIEDASARPRRYQGVRLVIDDEIEGSKATD